MSRMAGVGVPGFRADPVAIGALAALVDRQKDAAGIFDDQLRRAELTTDIFELGIVGVVLGRVEHWLDAARWGSRHATELAAAAARELNFTATYYDDTDRTKAAEMDRLYQPGSVDRLEPTGVRDPDRAARFEDWANASADPRDPGRLYSGPPESDEEALTEIEGWPHGIEEKADKLVGLGGIPSGIADVVERLTGLDIFKEISTTFAGDWAQLHRQAVLFQDTGTAFTAIAANIDHGRFGVQDLWDGNAADGAETWLAQFSSACTSYSTFMSEASDRIRNFAEFAYHTMKQLEYMIGLMWDIALLLLDALTLGRTSALLDGIGIGIAIVSGGGMGADGYEALKDLLDGDPTHALALIGQLNAIVQEIGTVLTLIAMNAHKIAATNALIDAMATVRGCAWPAEPYDHAGV